MGAFNSLHSKLQDFSDANEEETEQATPDKFLKHKCVIGLDPRSPSENIDRTPIVVDGTPHIQSKAFRTRIPSRIQNMTDPLDPRSPSAEFTRTPLSFGQTTAVNPDTPLKAPIDFPSASAIYQESNVQQPQNQEEKLCDTLNQSASSSEHVLTTDGSMEESFDTVPLLESTKKLHISSNIVTKKTVSSVSELETETDDSFSSQSKLRCRQVNRIMGHQTSYPINNRSPLSLVDNSSRVSQLPKKRTGGKTDSYLINNSSALDKENVCN